MMFLILVESADTFILKDYQQLIDFKVCLPPQLQFEEVYPERLEVVDDLLVGI